MSRACAALVFLLLWAGGADAQPTTAPRTTVDPRRGSQVRTPAEPAATAAAEHALGTLRQLAQASNPQALGFESAEDLKSMSLGEPLKVYVVRLDELRAFDGTRAAETIIHPTQRLLFPVLVQGRARSSIEVAPRAGSQTWKATTLGRPRTIETLFAFRDRLLLTAGVNAGEFAVVEVPALSLSFLSVVEGGQLFLVPDRADPRFRWDVGARLPATAALQRLVPAAKAVDSRFPN